MPCKCTKCEEGKPCSCEDCPRRKFECCKPAGDLKCCCEGKGCDCVDCVCKKKHQGHQHDGSGWNK